jgi:hypothetical protein
MESAGGGGADGRFSGQSLELADGEAAAAVADTRTEPSGTQPSVVGRVPRLPARIQPTDHRTRGPSPAIQRLQCAALTGHAEGPYVARVGAGHGLPQGGDGRVPDFIQRLLDGAAAGAVEGNGLGTLAQQPTRGVKNDCLDAGGAEIQSKETHGMVGAILGVRSDAACEHAAYHLL